ncbi:DUF1775 domain-containing protein [Deinococcus hopiensis]|uniref:Uncharacterized protein YcnI n=1 Tax=Deinococcus hopiensis KR-140 TaxID=695939 RepID=A0A1W1VHC3_9DEIO|nr:DUF1775 domain-containing protein [Deinococcus hopiensis]SMB92451.1 Uncharacterized protein YcnI [Deinococcus hopiensis KR-140]
MFKRVISTLLLTLLSLAAAHAVVRTEAGLTESTAATSETYRLQVPTEKNVATTGVRPVVPAGMTVTRFQVLPGFVRSLKINGDGLITEVSWKGRIAPQEYARFFFQARNPAQPGPVSWKVDQTYADGSVVAWGDTSPDAPASKTAIK